MSLEAHEIRQIVKEVIAEQRSTSSTDDAVLKAVASILTSFGMDEEDRKELRADFQHLRKWRKSTEQAAAYSLKAAITVIVTGVIGIVVMGIKVSLGK